MKAETIVSKVFDSTIAIATPNQHSNFIQKMSALFNYANVMRRNVATNITGIGDTDVSKGVFNFVMTQ